MILNFILFFLISAQVVNNQLVDDENCRFEFRVNLRKKNYTQAIELYKKLKFKTSKDTLLVINAYLNTGNSDFSKYLFISVVNNNPYFYVDDYTSRLLIKFSDNKLSEMIKDKNANYIKSRKLPEISSLLDSLMNLDQDIRKKLVLEMNQNKYSDSFMKLNQIMGIVDSLNLATLKTIGVFNGTIPLKADYIGLNGIKSIFFIVQHGDSPEQKSYLLENMAELSVLDKMMLKDRLHIEKDNYQIYGTQYDGNFDTMYKILDKEVANKYRISHHLITVDHQIELDKIK